MKKLILAFGSVFLLSAVILPGFAHQFFRGHDHENLAVRPHTERFAPLNYYQVVSRRAQLRERRAQNQARVSNVSSLTTRPRTSGVDNPRRLNTTQDRFFIVREDNFKDRLGNVDLNNRNRDVISNIYKPTGFDGFSFSHPRGFAETENSTFRGTGTSLAYRVLKLNSGTCTLASFWTCAQSHNQAFRSSAAFSSVQNVQTSLRQNQTNHSSFDFYPTITESFDTRVNGKSYTYYTYTVLNPLDNSVIRIEAVSNTSEKPRVAQVTHNIFESFRYN